MCGIDNQLGVIITGQQIMARSGGKPAMKFMGTFTLWNFATFLTRSGIFSSVHAFSTSPIGWMFLAFMAVLLLGGLTLIVRRREALRPERVAGNLRPLCFVTVALLANLGYASVGVVISALTAQLSHRNSLLPLLLLPLMTPVIMSAAAATRLLVAADLNEQWWRWVQLLGCFAMAFTTLGALVFEFVSED